MIQKIKTVIVKKRIHLWLMFYLLLIINAPDPLAAYFDLSPATFKIIRNLGFAGVPLVVLFAWFHGEPDRQPFNLKEALVLFLGALTSGLIYYQLSKAPPKQLTLLTPLSLQNREWFEEHILHEFEDRRNVDIVLPANQAEYEQSLLTALQQNPDSSNLALAYVPLGLTGVLFNDHREKLISFEEVASDHLNESVSTLDARLQELDAFAVAYGRDKRQQDDRLYFLPAEYDATVLVYSPKRVDEAMQNWRSQVGQAESHYRKLTGFPFPLDYRLESEPEQWDMLDLFVISWLFANSEYDGARVGRLAGPSWQRAILTNVLNKSLALGARVEDVFSLPGERNGSVAQAITEAFLWDAVFRSADLYHPGIWMPAGSTESEIVQLIQTGRVFLAFLSNNFLPELIESCADFRVATLPSGLSVAGEPGRRDGFSNMWFWAIPRSSPSYEISYDLAFELVSHHNQSLMSHKLLKVPVRKGLLAPPVADHASAGQLYPELLKQVRINRTGDKVTNPFARLNQASYDILHRCYHAKWELIIAGRGFRSGAGKVDGNVIKGLLMLP